MKRGKLGSESPLGQFILKRMAELGLRQSDVARRSQLSPSHINRLICGKVSKPHGHSRVVERLAGALEVAVEELGRFFPRGGKSSSLIESGIVVSERTAALLRAIETVSNKPISEVLEEGQQLEIFLKGVLRQQLDKGNKI